MRSGIPIEGACFLWLGMVEGREASKVLYRDLREVYDAQAHNIFRLDYHRE